MTITNQRGGLRIMAFLFIFCVFNFATKAEILPVVGCGSAVFNIYDGYWEYDGTQDKAALDAQIASQALLQHEDKNCMESFIDNLGPYNHGYYISVTFNELSATDFSFRLGPDFGGGGAVFLDGQYVIGKTDDLWWAGNWGNASQLLEAYSIPVAAGFHVLEIYGWEHCCMGAMSLQIDLTSDGIWECAGALDSDGDGTDDCNDGCPTDPNKTSPGQCGCGNADTDSDCDGVSDCNDVCPGGDDGDDDNDGIPNCQDLSTINLDWMCGSNKVYICHIPPGNPENAHTICVSINAVAEHITEHGDYLGPCGNANCGGELKKSNDGKNLSFEDMDHSHIHSSEAADLSFKILPNPNHGDFKIIFETEIENISVHIYNLLGQEVWNRQVNHPASQIQIHTNDFSKTGFGLYQIVVKNNESNSIKPLLILK